MSNMQHLHRRHPIADEYLKTAKEIGSGNLDDAQKQIVTRLEPQKASPQVGKDFLKGIDDFIPC